MVFQSTFLFFDWNLKGLGTWASSISTRFFWGNLAGCFLSASVEAYLPVSGGPAGRIVLFGGLVSVVSLAELSMVNCGAEKKLGVPYFP